MARLAGRPGCGFADPPFWASPSPVRGATFPPAAPRRTRSPPGSTSWPSSLATLRARVTISESGAGSIAHASGLTVAPPPRCSAMNGRRGAMRRNGCATSHGRWHRPRQRDRLPPRRPPLSLSAGGLGAIRRPVEHTRRIDTLFLRYPGRRLGGVPPPRGDSRPTGCPHHSPRALGRRHRRSSVASTAPALADTDGGTGYLAGMPASRSGVSRTHGRHRRILCGAQTGRGTRMACRRWSQAWPRTGRTGLSHCLAGVPTSSAGPRPSTVARARTCSRRSGTSDRMNPTIDPDAVNRDLEMHGG